MLGQDETIINNKINTGLDDYIIHIDHAVITNTLSNISFNICLESTGATVDGVFRSYKDYVFFIQNNLMQHSGMCVSFNNLLINSRRVRLENNDGNIIRAVIVDNILIPLKEGEEYDFGQNAPPEPVIMPQNNRIRNVPVKEYSLEEISNDRQNVHNSTIVHKFKTLYEKIINHINKVVSKNDIDNFSIDDAYTNLMSNSGFNNSILCYNNKKLKTLSNILEYSKKQNGFIYNLNDNECNIFKYVIIYINNCVDSSYKADTFKLLANNMLDCLENNSIVCLTGRITRMLNSIEHLVSCDKYKIDDDCNDKQNNSININDIRQEMLAKAMVMFNNNLKISDIKEAIMLDYPNIDKECLRSEIDSWDLENLY